VLPQHLEMKFARPILKPSNVCLLAVLSLGLGTEGGCKKESDFHELRISTVEDAMNLSQLKTQASFRATVMSADVAVERPRLPQSVPFEVPATNFYQLVLRDQQGRKYVFAGVNAATSDIDALGKLVQSNTYTFPDVLLK